MYISYLNFKIGRERIRPGHGAPVEWSGLGRLENHGKSTAFFRESNYFLISRPIGLLIFNAAAKPERAPVGDFFPIGRLFHGEQTGDGAPVEML